MEKILEVTNLKKIYSTRKKKTVAVNGISFAGYKGEILGILGPNGSGKTTTIKSVATIIDFDEGSVSIFGYDNRKHKRKILENMGAVLEGARNVYWNLTPVENIRYFAGLKGLNNRDIKDRSEYLLRTLGIENVANKQVREFSKGMQQKVAICCAFIGRPSFIMLDEPTLGLDVETSRQMKKWIKENNRKENNFTLITSHDMKFIEDVCDRVIIIKEGAIIAEDSVSNLRSAFSNKIYQIEIGGIVNDGLLASLKSFASLRTEKTDSTTRLFLTISDNSKIYDIFNVLNRGNREILSLDIINDDFEDIFVKILKKDKNNA